VAKWLLPLAAVALLLYLARAILTPLVVAAILAYIFSPTVDEVEERTHLPRLAVVAILYIVLLGLLGAGIWVIETQLVREALALQQAGPDLVDVALVRLLGADSFQLFGQTVDAHLIAVWTNQQLTEMLGTPSDAFRVAERAFDIIAKTLLTLVALFYLLLDGDRLAPYLLRFVPGEQRATVLEVADHVHRVLGRYLRGQLFLIALMASVTYVVLSFGFHLPFALPIAIATGVLEVIPLFGPVAAGTIASVVAVVHGGPGVMIGVIIAYLVLRQLEDQLVMPIVVGRAVDVHPLAAICAVLTGASVAGVLGAILGVPIAAALRITLDYAFGAAQESATATQESQPEERPTAAEVSS
jgi:predicted PurR-regulated permease PerM